MACAVASLLRPEDADAAGVPPAGASPTHTDAPAAGNAPQLAASSTAAAHTHASTCPCDTTSTRPATAAPTCVSIRDAPSAAIAEAALRGAVELLKAEVAQLKAELCTEQQRVAELRMSTDQCEAAKREVVADMSQLHARVDALVTEAERSRGTMVAALRAEMAKLAGTTRAFSTENAALRARVGDLEGALERSRVALEKQADNMKARLVETKRQAAQLAADNAALRTQVDNQKAANAQLRSEAAEFRGVVERELSALDTKAEALRSDVYAIQAIQVFDFEGLVMRVLHSIEHNNLTRVCSVAIAARSPAVAAAISALQQPAMQPGTGAASGTPAAGSTEVDASRKSIDDAGAAAIAKALAARPCSTVTKVRRPNCRMPLLDCVRPDSTVSLFRLRRCAVGAAACAEQQHDWRCRRACTCRCTRRQHNTASTVAAEQFDWGSWWCCACQGTDRQPHADRGLCWGQRRDGGCGPHDQWPACESAMVCTLSALLVGTCVQLDLCQNKIGDSGAIAMAEMLAVNSTLQGLDLPCNSIGSPGASALAKALASNHTLREVCDGGSTADRGRDTTWYPG